MKIYVQNLIPWYQIMKLTFSQLLIAFIFTGISYSNPLTGQVILEKNINLTVKDISLSDALKELSQKYNVKFIYSESLIAVDKQVSIDAVNKSLKLVLNQLLESNDINYEVVKDKIILLKPQETAVLDQQIAIENIRESIDFPVSGKVVDTNGEPLIGTSVLEKGTKNGVSTDANGNFKITVKSPDAVLVLKYIGFKDKEVSVNGQRVLNITLEENVNSLNEVVVVGYGQVRKQDLTGAVSSVKAEDLARSTVSSLDQGLSGRASGVQVTQQSGQPGGATSIRIRGGNSINSSNEPLYVIDGFPYYNNNEAASAGAIGGAPAMNALATLNPNDIESIEVLKDASATAIYGSRGANGVILITTKRGKAGKNQIGYETYYGFQDVSKILPVLNARQYAEFRNQSYVDARGLKAPGKPTYTAEEVASFGEGTNWQKEIFQTAPIQNHQLSFNGGTPDLQYAISANYFDQDGIVINSGLKRYSARANIDAKVNDRIKIGNNFTASHIAARFTRSGGGRTGSAGVQSPSAGNTIQDALFYNPIIPVRNASGNFTIDNNVDGGGKGGGNQANTPNGNPVALATLATQQGFTTRFLDNLFAEASLFKDFTLRLSLGADVITNKENSYVPGTVRSGMDAPNGSASIGNVTSYSWLNENTLTYRKRFNDKHSLDALAGFTIQRFRSERAITRGRDFSTDLTTFNNIGAAGIIDVPTSDFNQWSLLSYLFRVNYNLASKYLFTFSGRADGSSKFGAENKYGFFPSGAFAYRVSEEEFIKSLGFINDLKLRGSAGITGNQEIPGYQTLSVLDVRRYGFNNTVPAIGFAPGRLGNSGIKWETTRQADIGLDLEMFNGRLAFTADAYYKKTTDLLLEVTLPYSSGYDAIFQNIGAVQNKGLEFSVNSVNFDRAFRWTTQFNMAFNRNKVLDFGNEKERYIGQNNNLLKGQAVSVIRVGESLGNFIGFVNDGIIKNEEELKAAPKSGFDYIGSRRFKDLNGDGLITDADRTTLGNALPDFTGGFQNSFAYKNLSLDVFFQYSYGNEVYNMTQLELEFLNGRQNQSTTVLDRFVPGVNEDTDVARAGNPSYVDFRKGHSRYIEDGSYLRLKNLTLSYNLPLSKWRGVAWMKDARIFASGQNIWVLTKYRGYDPEVNINPQSNTLLGVDYATYPSAKLYTAGFKATF